MASITLGRLEKVELREVWTSESGDFTPWLAQEENLKLLGDTIGIELELEAKEKDVGPFRADILCKDTGTDAWVLIENQLEQTDHTHLGQLLTYAAGLQAVTIVWIAERIREQHRATLDWLNEITDDRFNFFALEIELWKIGDSLSAPKFNIVCQPNDWAKSVAVGAAKVESEAKTEGKQLQEDFWRAFRDYVLGKGSFIKPTKPLPQGWMNFALGRGGFGLTAVASLYDSVAESFESGEVRAEFLIVTLQSKAYYKALEAQKAAIEQEVGEALQWYNPQGKKTCRIYLRKPADIRDTKKWPEYHEWLLSKLEALYKAFAPRVKNLDDVIEEEMLSTEPETVDGTL